MKHVIAYVLLFALFTLQGCDEKGTTEGQIRKISLFNSRWKFIWGDDPRSFIESFEDTSWRELDLPHDWRVDSAFATGNPATLGGVGWYRKTFIPDAAYQDKVTYIDFDGICRKSSVWLNGHLLGEKENGCLPFWYNLTPYLRYGKKNTLAVRVDNIPLPDSCRYAGSGICRNVRLVTVDPLHIGQEGTSVTTKKVSAEAAGINLRMVLQNSSPADRHAEVVSVVTDAQGTVKARTSSVLTVSREGQAEIVQAMTLENPKPGWDTLPNTYTITTRIVENGRAVDEYDTPLGIR